jgi:hypothetical protein
VGNSEQKKKTFSSIFTTDTKSFIHVTRIAAMHIIYMCRLRHVNDSVLSSLKMEGIRLLFPWTDAPIHKVFRDHNRSPKSQIFLNKPRETKPCRSSIAFSASRCSGLSVLRPSHYRKSSDYVNGHARRQQISPSRDCSKSGHQLQGFKRLEVQHYQIR